MPINVKAPRPRRGSRASPLSAGAAMADITPPLEVGFLKSSVEGRWEPFRSIRTPLRGRALVLECTNERVALISLDLLGLNNKSVGGWSKFKRAISRAAKGAVEPGRIIVTCTHSHSAPESSAVTYLYRTTAFQKWVEHLIEHIGHAMQDAVASLRPCRLRLAVGELAGFSLQRRIPQNGRIVMSDTVQPISSELMSRKPVDHRVHALQIRGSDNINIATLIHAICHPVHEMCFPHVSADFPGELCSALKRSEGGLPMFVNGAAGDINPPTVSEGLVSSCRHGIALAETVKTSLSEAVAIEPCPF